MSAGDVFENKYLDAGLGTNRSTVMPATVYVALFTAAPTDAGGGTEVSAASTAYARVAVVNNSTNWPDAVASQKKNGTAIQFPEATAGWGTVTHFAIMDAATAGNIMHWGILGTSRVVASGEIPVFQINALVITAD